MTTSQKLNARIEHLEKCAKQILNTGEALNPEIYLYFQEKRTGQLLAVPTGAFNLDPKSAKRSLNMLFPLVLKSLTDKKIEATLAAVVCVMDAYSEDFDDARERLRTGNLEYSPKAHHQEVLIVNIYLQKNATMRSHPYSRSGKKINFGPIDISPIIQTRLARLSNLWPEILK